MDAANPEIMGISDTCKTGNASAGNGLIETLEESACATEELVRTGLLRGSPNSPLLGRHGIIQLLSATASGVGGDWGAVHNVILFENIPGDEATSVDVKLDDGNPASGEVRSSGPTCQGNDPVSLAIALL